MPLAISPDGKGWVRVPPPQRRRKITPADRSDALKHPLAYFACTPVPAPKPRIPDIPVYTLDPNEHTPPGSAASARHHQNHAKGGRRSASTPLNNQHRHPYDEEFDNNYDAPQHRRSRHPPPSSTISHERVRPRPTPGAVAAAVHAAMGGTSPPKPRAVTTSTNYTYWTGPSNAKAGRRAAAETRSTGSGSTGAGMGVSARWANATAPLAL